MLNASGNFRSAILTLNPKVTQEEWDYFEAGFKSRQLYEKEYFIKAGGQNQHLGFIVSGLIRQFYLNERGEEITIDFIKENGWVTDYPSLLSGRASRYYFQCLESTKLITIAYAHIVRGYEQFVGFERNGRLIAENVLIGQQQRIESLQFDSAEQRYLDFIKESPDLFNRISLTHLSSYLGIERPSLSRIRKKIARL